MNAETVRKQPPLRLIPPNVINGRSGSEWSDRNAWTTGAYTERTVHFHGTGDPDETAIVIKSPGKDRPIANVIVSTRDLVDALLTSGRTAVPGDPHYRAMAQLMLTAIAERMDRMAKS
jgi:hypothetical protein